MVILSSSAPRHLSVHRLLFIKDILASKTTSRPDNLSWDFASTGQPEKYWEFSVGKGKHKLAFWCVRVLGTLIKVEEIENRQSSNYYIDDTTGVIPCIYTPPRRPDNSFGEPVPLFEVGSQIELLGVVKTNPSGSKYIEFSRYQISTTPISVPLRFLEIINLYKNHYFPSLFSASASVPSTSNSFTFPKSTPSKLSQQKHSQVWASPQQEYKPILSQQYEIIPKKQPSSLNTSHKPDTPQFPFGQLNANKNKNDKVSVNGSDQTHDNKFETSDRNHGSRTVEQNINIPKIDDLEFDDDDFGDDDPAFLEALQGMKDPLAVDQNPNQNQNKESQGKTPNSYPTFTFSSSLTSILMTL
ncbi:hypothetical protein BKA69DRAFT_276741 [Paraphysoderma sedebokerense]|nr:hypothetical protein BKA69DRAFT_276741 [Paraphysoderma sedebokerense]